jgi:hypothetical protein
MKMPRPSKVVSFTHAYETNRSELSYSVIGNTKIKSKASLVFEQSHYRTRKRDGAALRASGAGTDVQLSLDVSNSQYICIAISFNYCKLDPVTSRHHKFRLASIILRIKDPAISPNHSIFMIM